MKVNQCPECGAPMEDSVSEGLCPKCLMAVNIATQTRLSEGEGEGATGQASHPRPRNVLKPEEIADLFPNFEIIELLGRGGMGVVYKARQKSLDRLVALKVIAPERTLDDQFYTRFAREAKILANLNQPNIVTVHDFGEVGGMCFLVMELVDGVNLRQLLKKGLMKPEEALSIVPAICTALEFAHQQGVVHRDVKPENVLIDKQGNVKIADFGIAKILGANERGAGQSKEPLHPSAKLTQEERLGTPSYMAPEQKEQPTLVDHRADIYSLGIVIYEMLTGELPTAPFQRPSKKVAIDVRIDEAVIRAIEKEPELRYQTAAQLKEDVETVIEDRGTPTMLFDWRTWSPFQSDLAREVCNRMTEPERRAMFQRDVFLGLMMAVPLIAFFIGMDILLPDVPLGVVILLQFAMLLAAVPFYILSERRFICTTAWARARGITPDSLRRSWYERLANLLGFRVVKRLWKSMALLLTILVIASVSVGSWLQRPRSLGDTISATTPDGMLNADAQTLHAMRIFGGDKTWYRFRVQGYAGDINRVWDVAVPVRILAREYTLLPLVDVRFDRHGSIVWSDDGLRVSFRIDDVELFAFNSVDSSHSFEGGFQPQQEVTLQTGDRLQNAFLDLDTGVVMSAPNDLVRSLERDGKLSRGVTQISNVADWMREVGADVMARPGLGLSGLVVGTLDAGDERDFRTFDVMPASEVIKAATELERLAEETMALEGRESKDALFGISGKQPAMFLTREGSAGLVQIRKSDNGTHSGMIRLSFKLVDQQESP